jgi:GTP-binding protein
MNIVAIVGRPNVGKSTLFNRLTGVKKAIVEAVPGVTRDRIYGETDWNGKKFAIIDTGGFIPGSEDTIERAIREQAFIAIEEADAVVFVCDGRDGVTPFDEDIATILRTSNKPVALVVNKCDNFEQDMNSYEFHRLGLGEPFAVSALNGRSTGDFLDYIASFLAPSNSEEEDNRLKIAIVGQPNVGKSSITNALLGKNRSIVTDIPGTTRDAIDSIIRYYDQEIVLIDTAGLRKKGRIKENIELFSVIRTSRAIERCDVAVVVIDASLGLEDMDKKILNQIDAARKGMILAVNKWDLLEKDSNTAAKFSEKILEALPSYSYLPIVYISALTKQRITRIPELALKIQEKRSTRISTSKLNDTIIPILDKTPPPSIRGRDLRINYITQVKTEPPVFAFFANHPQLIPDAYKRYMERVFRENFDFEGVPISFVFRRKNIKWEEREK